MSRSVNKVILIGNLTRDPELRYTPQGNAVASFVVATNREWNVDGNKKEAVDFHNVVAWNKLGELCGQLLAKGTKVYVEGRLQTRDWTDTEGKKRYKTEVVIDEMIILVSKKQGGPVAEGEEGSTTTTTTESGETFDNGNLDELNLDEVLGQNLDSPTE